MRWYHWLYWLQLMDKNSTTSADTMSITFNRFSIDDYRLFLKVKRLPRYRFVGGRTAIIPKEYANLIGVKSSRTQAIKYTPLPSLFDYQRDIAGLSIRKRKFAVFAECGLGKSLILMEFARHAVEHLPKKQCVLIVSPLMVVKQTIAEAKRFYGDDLQIDIVRASELQGWLQKGGRIGITNYEALNRHVEPGRLGGLILDESSLLKSHYGKWGAECIRLGRGLNWKLALTGTPAPNDRIEYANHAVFLDRFPTVNSFLARFFVNRGQTDNRWELKPHALRPFYRALSDWCIFLNNPATYGWKDNCGKIPPIHVHIDEVKMTRRQRELAFEKTGKLFASDLGGIGSRSQMGQIAKGYYKGEKIDSNKLAFIQDLIASWPQESTLVWCLYNAEQELISRGLPGAGNITGDTEQDERERIIEEFQAGRTRSIVTKAKILGFGLNLQIATRQVFSGLQDSYESFHQAVKRSNRIGSTRPLNVHIPVTEIERPMIDTVLRKAHRIEEETREQEALFRESAGDIINAA